MSKLNPKSRQEALLYQLQDIISWCAPMAMLGDNHGFNQQLQLLKKHIDGYMQLESLDSSLSKGGDGE